MPTPTKPIDVEPPVLRVTRYEQVSAFLVAIVAGLVFAVVLLGFAWYSTRVPKPKEPVPVELVELTGGSEDGAVGETLRVDSPLEANPEAGSPETASDEPEVRESLDNVLELTDVAVTQTTRQFDMGIRNPAGQPGSAEGTGRRPLGSGPGSGGGFPREQRWMVRFGDQANLDEYARQLDFFGIEFGAVINGKLVYISKLASPKPAVRTAASGADEKRLYMTWRGGGRKQADLQLFRKAGLEVGNAVIFHFYPKQTEDKLARLELDYRKRKANDIRRTFFSVKNVENGYEFTVAHQTYLK
ncbi:MAG: hypothetical protein ACM3U2_14600 [Deltaproteobacteria bacterium]